MHHWSWWKHRIENSNLIMKITIILLRRLKFSSTVKLRVSAVHCSFSGMMTPVLNLLQISSVGTPVLSTNDKLRTNVTWACHHHVTLRTSVIGTLLYTNRCCEALGGGLLSIDKL